MVGHCVLVGVLEIGPLYLWAVALGGGLHVRSPADGVTVVLAAHFRHEDGELSPGGWS